MYLTRSEILSEEIVQDVFLKVWQKREELNDISYFNAWLRTVAKNTCFNYLRKLAIEEIGNNRYALYSESTSPSSENDLIAKEYQQLLDAAVQKLPPQQKKVYELSRQAGKKQEEIAREMNISIYTVKEYMKLALRTIRKHLEDNLDTTILLILVPALKKFFS